MIGAREIESCNSFVPPSTSQTCHARSNYASDRTLVTRNSLVALVVLVCSSRHFRFPVPQRKFAVESRDSRGINGQVRKPVAMSGRERYNFEGRSDRLDPKKLGCPAEDKEII